MKRSFWISVAVIAGLLVIGSVLLRPRPVTPQSPAGSEPLRPTARVAPADTVLVAAAPVVAATRSSAVVSPGAITPVTESGPEPTLRIKAGAVLATVNGVPIELKDLLPLPVGKASTGQIMSAERYAFLLDRAVDREITLQTARAQGMDLTESQREKLATLRVRGERPPGNVFDDLQHNPVNADFEARDAAASLLQAALAEKAGVPSSAVTAEQVEHYYQQHRNEYAVPPPDSAQRPTAWEGIDQDIRVKLARQAQALHDESFQKYLDRTRATAQVRKTEPSS